MLTTKYETIEKDAIDDWIEKYVSPLFPENYHISVMPDEPWDYTGQDGFFSAINVDKPITIEQLIKREVLEHKRGIYVHFYVQDVIAAAVGSGELTGNYYYVYYKS